MNTSGIDPRSDRDKVLAAMAMLKAERSTWDSHCAEISTFLLPRNSRFVASDRNNGGRKYNSIYDNSATRALRILGAGLMSGATNPSHPWFRLATPDRDLMKYPSVKIWLGQVAQLMFDIFSKSNTYRSLHTMYEELGAFSTSASFVLDDFDNVIHHSPMTFGEFAIGTNDKGIVNEIGREFEMMVGQMVGKFGYANCSSMVQNAYDKGNYTQWVPVVHLIEPNRTRDPSKIDKSNMAFKSSYIEPGNSGYDRDKFLSQGGFRKFRALAPRWGLVSNDIYGSNGPGMETLGDIKQLQHEQVRKGEGIDYQTKPPLQVPTRLKGRALDRMPGGVSYYDAAQPQGGVRTLFEAKLDLGLLLNDIQDVRDRIRQSFYVDLFMMISNMDRTQKTATEVAELHEEKLLMLGPVLERLHNELLEPLIDMTFDRVLTAKGPDGQSLLPPPPQELQGVELRVEYISVLAQAQRAVDVNSIDRYTMALGNIAAVKPDVLDKFDSDKWAEIYADRLGVDPELIVPGEQVAVIRQQRNQAQAQAQQMQMANAGADTAAKLSQANTGDKNALTDIANAAAAQQPA